MAFMPTDNQLRGLQSVAQSSDGINAIANKIDGLQCVHRGWLHLQEHRREDGGLLDVWSLTKAGQEILSRLAQGRREIAAPDASAAALEMALKVREIAENFQYKSPAV